MDDADAEDLRDAGTDVVDILVGRAIPLRLGDIPMTKCGQRYIDRSKPIQQAVDAEHNFFEHHPSYQGKAQCCGTLASLTWFVRTLK